MEDWDKINAVQRMQDYVLSHLGEEITMQALSGAAGYSLWHSLRIFRELTGKTPFEYIRAARLTKAAETLRDTGEHVLTVALDTGFDSHDGFTRAFSRQFDITPRKYREETPPVSYFTYYPIRNYYLTMSKRNDEMMENKKVSATVTVTAVERPARKLILLRSKNAADYFTFCDEMGCDWEGLMNSVPERFDNAALITLPGGLVRGGTSATAVGIEVPAGYSKPVPGNYEIIDLPPCTMLYFQGMPFASDEDFCEAIDIVMEAVASYKLETYGYASADDAAPRFNFGASASTGAKMAIPVR